MPMPRAPIDPYCRLNGKGARVTTKDPDGDLAALAAYARAHRVEVWRYPDGKLALTSQRYARELNRGKQPELAPLVFGSEGASLQRTAAEAMSALREQSTYLTESIRLREKVEAQARAQRLDPVDEVPDPVDLAEAVRVREGDVTQTVRTFLNDAPTLEEPARELNGGRRWLAGSVMIPVESALRRMGGAGAKLADLFARRNELVARIRASAFTRLNAQLERLTPEEIATDYALYVEKGIVKDEARRPILESVYQQLNDIDEQFYTQLQALGVEVAPRVTTGRLNPTGRYFPHRRDLSALGDRRLADAMIAETRERAAQYGVQLTPDQALDVIEAQGFGTIKSERAVNKMIEAAARHGHVLPEGDARRLLDHITRGADRISGSLERDRILHFEGYITDARRAYTATWTRNAYRVADVATFGQADAKVHQLLGEMRYDPKLGGRAEKFARDVYDLEIGRTRNDPSAFFRELYGWQAAKLSLALLANSTQSFNTFIRVGLRPLALAARDALMHPRAFTGIGLTERPTVATIAGALPTKAYGSDATVKLINAMTQDIRDVGMTAMLGAERVIGERAGRAVDTLLDAALTPFRWVENFNRSLAQRAGEYYFDQLVEQLAARGTKGLGSQKIGARLRELGFDPERVLGVVQRGDTVAQRELRTLAGLRTSNETQFQSNYQSMPLWANNSELGRFAFQYKNFAINQARFVLRELSPAAAKRDPARFVRTVATIGAAYPAVGIVLTQARQNMMGPTLSGDQLSELLDDPTLLNVLRAGAISMTLAGSLGILADIGAVAAIGNGFAMRNFFVPPAASTVINLGWEVPGSVMRAITNADAEELYRARSALLREFGGIGAGIEEQLRRREGRSEEPASLTDAVRQAF